jgi:hypothetical protein
MLKKPIRIVSVAVLSFLFCLTVVGCSANSNIAGTWKTDQSYAITFSPSGDFSEGNSNFHGMILGSEFSFQSYSISGGTLTFRGQVADPVILKKSSSKDCGDGEYYLNGDTLVIEGTTFVRVK